MTYYQILGVKRSATQDEIKNAYKNLMKKYHPDVYQGDKLFAEQKAKQINLAYDVLSNPSSRAAYDEEITPTPNYNYTPPKYNSPYGTTYQSYYEQYYNRRYTNPNYTNTHTNTNSAYYKASQMHSDFTNKIIQSISKMKIIQKVIIFCLIFLIYLVLLLLTFSQYNNIESTIQENQSIRTNEQQNQNSNSNSNEFDINDYLDDDILYKYYIKNGFSEYYTFEEYKAFVADKFYEEFYNK